MEGGDSSKKRPLDIDWVKLIDGGGGQPPVELVVTRTPPSGSGTTSFGSETTSYDDDIRRKSDDFLKSFVERNSNPSKCNLRLPDGGAKLRKQVERFEAELERRQSLRVEKDCNGVEENTSLAGESCDNENVAAQSVFATKLMKNMDEDHQDSRAGNAFRQELGYLKPCTQKWVKPNSQIPGRGRRRNDVSLRQSTFKCPSSLSVDVDKRNKSKKLEKGSHSSACSPCHVKTDLSAWLIKEKPLHEQPSRNLRPRNRQSFVLVDEEEPDLVETTCQEEKLDECMKDTTVFYPSRDDPECVEICYTDMECLAPEAYLSSTIMNFYIRYLQQVTSPSEREKCNYHFFNTYFYKKLMEAVQAKQSDKEALFLKFRRWWKGVNIFEKAYILFPVHESQHWSLVIICIPDKEDEFGPILLHLDSLGLHSSGSVFKNVRSFLKEEWEYLRKGGCPLDLPFTDKIWQNLDRRMEEKRITVPQQRNDYDCGVFVLFFMKRFIDDAPERLKKKHFEMFGKKWFEPEEASGLRRTIHKLLVEEFKKASEKPAASNLVMDDQDQDRDQDSEVLSV